MPTSAEDRSNWVQRASLNLLSDSNLTAVGGAFRHPRAVVFGWQYHYFGALFFCSVEHLERWRAGTDQPYGAALDLTELAQRGADTWRELVV